MRPHPDVDLLALHALGEPVLDDTDRSHLQTCQTCSTTVEALSHTVRTVRGDRDETLTPDLAERSRGAGTVPPHVWQGIASELGLAESVRPASVGPSIVPARSGAPSTDVPAAHPGVGGLPASRDPQRSVDPLNGLRSASGAASGGPGAPSPSSPAPSSPVPSSPVPSGPVPAEAAGHGRVGGRPTRRSRLRRAAPLLAVAAAGLAVGVAGSAVVGSLDGGDAPADPQVLAAADLEAFGRVEGTSVTGAARLETRPAEGVDGAGAADGTRVLQVWLDELPDTGADGFLEAWLIDPVTGSMVSLGPVDTGSGGAATVELTVPSGLDVSTYALVDVSAEPLDGDPTHSGDSLLRGTLGT